MRHCEVCGGELKPHQERFCSQQCKSIAQTKEWQIVQELRKTGKVTFVQLTIIVQQRYGKRNLDERLSEILKLLKQTGRVEIKIKA
jgi:predicted nucleic acid-binding Zn ribbon protein